MVHLRLGKKVYVCVIEVYQAPFAEIQAKCSEPVIFPQRLKPRNLDCRKKPLKPFQSTFREIELFIRLTDNEPQEIFSERAVSFGEEG